MDIVIKKDKNVEIGLSQQNPHISVGSPREISMGVASQSINLTPKKTRSIAFEFVQKVVAGANVIRCTLAEFEAMERYDGRTWYAVTTTTDELRYLYLGSTLIAKAEQDSGQWGFAYSFPIIFGR